MTPIVTNLVLALIAKYGDEALEEILAFLHITDGDADSIKKALSAAHLALAKPGTTVPTQAELDAQVKAAILSHT